MYNNVIKQKEQLEETEQIVRENLKRVQKARKAYYDKSKCHGRRFCVGDRVWYRNRTKSRVAKVLSDVTYCIEEERRKAGEQRRRTVVHFNYSETCIKRTPLGPSLVSA